MCGGVQLKLKIIHTAQRCCGWVGIAYVVCNACVCTKTKSLSTSYVHTTNAHNNRTSLVRLTHSSCNAQGPARRPAVFSHDKLLWDWVQELLAGFGSPGGPSAPGIKTESDALDGGMRQQERQGSGSSAATTMVGERPQSSAASREGARVSLRDFCAKFMELPAAELQKLPHKVGNCFDMHSRHVFCNRNLMY